jgi:hypothetical protein
MTMARTQVAKTRIAKSKAPRFRYSDVPSADRNQCEEAVESILGYQRRMASDVVAIGCLLLDVKEKLEHGQFTAWIKHYFGWAQQTASNMMRAGETFGKVPNFGDLTIDTSAVYLLASMTCPDDLREEILDRASKGERITHATVREAIDELRRDDDDEPVAPPVSHPERRPRFDETIVIGDEEEEDTEQYEDEEEPIQPSPRVSRPFVEDDLAEETAAAVIEWSLASFVVSVRRLISDWCDRCPEDERGQMSEVLRDLANQIDNS